MGMWPGCGPSLLKATLARLDAGVGESGSPTRDLIVRYG